MRKTKTLKERASCWDEFPNAKIKKGVKMRHFDPAKKMGDWKVVATAFFQALQENDVQGAIEILEGYVMTVHKKMIVKKGRIPTSTLYHSLSKEANPTLRTIAKLLHAVA